MMPGMHIRDLEVFSHGLFQDILTLMETLDTEELSKEDVKRYRDNLIKYNNRIHSQPNRLKESKENRGSKKPCKSCKDKKKGK